MNCCVLDEGHSEGLKRQCMFGWYLLNHSTFCNQTWYCGVLSWDECNVEYLVLLSLRSRSQQGLKYSEWLFLLYLPNFWSICNQSWFNGHKLECPVKKLIVMLKVKVTVKVWKVEKCLDDISWAIQCFSTKLCLLVYFMRWVSYGKMVAVLRFKVTARACVIRMTVSIVSSELLTLWQSNLVWWYILVYWSALWKRKGGGEGITVFKVNVTGKLQDVGECLSIQYLLNYWTFSSRKSKQSAMN